MRIQSVLTGESSSTHIDAQHPHEDLSAKVASELRIFRAVHQLAGLVQDWSHIPASLSPIEPHPPSPLFLDTYSESTTWEICRAGRAPPKSTRTASWSPETPLRPKHRPHISRYQIFIYEILLYSPRSLAALETAAVENDSEDLHGDDRAATLATRRRPAARRRASIATPDQQRPESAALELAPSATDCKVPNSSTCAIPRLPIFNPLCSNLAR